MAVYSADFSTRDWYKLRFTLEQDEQDIAGNRTKFSYLLRVQDTGPGAGVYSSTSGSYLLQADGDTVKSGSWTVDFRNTDWRTLTSGSLWIPHDDDGTKQVTFQASATGPLVGSASRSVTLPLPRILRGPRLKQGSTWRHSVAFVRHNGVWKIAVPHAKQGGQWKVGAG